MVNNKEAESFYRAATELETLWSGSSSLLEGCRAGCSSEEEYLPRMNEALPSSGEGGEGGGREGGRKGEREEGRERKKEKCIDFTH